MAEDRVKRKLAAIVSADVVGWSRLMGEDEAGTLATLKRHRQELIDPKIVEYGGRIVSTAGDSVLVEYPSAVDAVKCSVDIQEAMAEHNAGLPEDKRMLFRVGVNLGEVIIDDHDVFGDGVNVAARLQALAEPGAVCVSGDVHRQVQGKLDVAFEDFGEKSVKNIAQPVHVYSVSPGSQREETFVATGEALPLPSKPSIAVLPFDNMSGDPEQEYFSDGVAEDIVTGLSRLRELFVIARNSSFTYKGRAVDVRQVAKELGVRYVLEGSVRRGGQRLRVTAQLIDSETGNHVWAEKFDGQVEDLFDFQDSITESVVGAIAPSVFFAEMERARLKRPENLDAYDLQLRGWAAFFRLSPDGVSVARNQAQAALTADPNYANANTLLAWANFMEWLCGWSADPGETLTQARKSADEAIMLDEGDAAAHAVLSYWHLVARNFDLSRVAAKRAVDLNPNLAAGHFALCGVNGFTQRGNDGLDDIHRAMRLSPRDPFRWGFLNVKIICHIALRDHVAGLEAASQLITLRREYPFGHANMAVCCGHLGRIEQGKRALAESYRIIPTFDRAFVEAAWPWEYPEDLEHTFEGLRKVGWKD